MLLLLINLLLFNYLFKLLRRRGQIPRIYDHPNYLIVYSFIRLETLYKSLGNVIRKPPQMVLALCNSTVNVSWYSNVRRYLPGGRPYMAMPGRMKSRSVPTPFRMAPELATCSEMFLFLQHTGIPENASNKRDIDRRLLICSNTTLFVALTFLYC